MAGLPVPHRRRRPQDCNRACAESSPWSGVDQSQIDQAGPRDPNRSLADTSDDRESGQAARRFAASQDRTPRAGTQSRESRRYWQLRAATVIRRFSRRSSRTRWRLLPNNISILAAESDQRVGNDRGASARTQAGDDTGAMAISCRALAICQWLELEPARLTVVNQRDRAWSFGERR